MGARRRAEPDYRRRARHILESRVPADEELVLNWGDARIGNVVFDPQTYVARALLDWEMATIASPELDLGWFVFFNRYFADGVGAAPLEGFQTRDEIIALYEALTGRTVKHLDFYEPLAAARTAILLLRIGRMMIEAGAVPADSPMPIANPGSILLATLLDLPAPDGVAVDFMNHRG
jgi:aminoglycoside phosphotransferase (APT) family kinase protein